MKDFLSDNLWFDGREEFDLIWKAEDKIQVSEIYQIIKKRKKSLDKAPGEDGVKFRYIRRIPDILLERMTECYNICLREGKFPRCWKKALLTLIPKDEINMEHPKVRPICLLNETAKIYERVLVDRIEAWMNGHPESRLTDNQYGFRRGRSTYEALNIVKEVVLTKANEDELVAGASLDIVNAFNSIRWKHIRSTFKEKGFPVYLRRAIDSYLSERIIEFTDSFGITRSREVTSGVPQGSVLGPVEHRI